MRTQTRTTSPIEELQDRVINAGKALGISPNKGVAVTAGAFFFVRDGKTYFHSAEKVQQMWDRLYEAPC